MHKYDTIRCTETQWSSSGVMERLAHHHFQQHPDRQFVEVYEHGGWYLGYRRDMTIWSTANDMAKLSPTETFPNGHSGNIVSYPDIQ